MEQLTFKVGTVRNPILIEFKEYNNQKIVDIRKYFSDKNDSNLLYPTKKGISLNVNQLTQVVEALNSNSVAISDFFETSAIKHIDIEIKTTIGRSFQCVYENNKTSVIIDESVKDKLPSENLVLFSQMLDSFSGALSEVLEHEDEMELIMDILNQRISRIL
jgi:hypothetical protein